MTTINLCCKVTPLWEHYFDRYCRNFCLEGRPRHHTGGGGGGGGNFEVLAENILLANRHRQFRAIFVIGIVIVKKSKVVLIILQVCLSVRSI